MGPMTTTWDRQRLATAIVQARRRRGEMTQADLAHASGLGITTIQRMELSAGPGAPYPKRGSTFAAVERAFGWPEGRTREIAEGRYPVDEDAPPTSAPEPDDEDEFVRILRSEPLTAEARDVLIETYLREKRKDDTERREKYLRLVRAMKG